MGVTFLVLSSILLTDLPLHSYSLMYVHRGHAYVYLVLIATWCIYCAVQVEVFTSYFSFYDQRLMSSVSSKEVPLTLVSTFKPYLIPFTKTEKTTQFRL